LIEMLCPAIVTVPDRVLVVVFCKNVAVAEPAVVPPAGDTLIQLVSLTDADHDPPLQPPGLALTVNVVEPPLAGTMGTDVGLAENVQVGGELIVSGRPKLAVALLESLTVNCGVLPWLPGAGVPLRFPLTLRVSPFGSPVADQV
jgi:hypothetical protein